MRAHGAVATAVRPLSSTPRTPCSPSNRELAMKQLLRSRWFLAVAIILVLGIPSTWLLARGPDPLESSIVAEVKRGEFRVIVSTSGELRALNDIKITGPPNMQQAQVYQVKISMNVPEGT